MVLVVAKMSCFLKNTFWEKVNLLIILMDETRRFFLIAMAVVLGIILAFNISSFTRCNTREGLQYLKQYEQQDEWRNSAADGDPMWPVAQIPASADYQIRRESF